MVLIALVLINHLNASNNTVSLAKVILPNLIRSNLKTYSIFKESYLVEEHAPTANTFARSLVDLSWKQNILCDPAMTDLVIDDSTDFCDLLVQTSDQSTSSLFPSRPVHS